MLAQGLKWCESINDFLERYHRVDSLVMTHNDPWTNAFQTKTHILPSSGTSAVSTVNEVCYDQTGEVWNLVWCCIQGWWVVGWGQWSGANQYVFPLVLSDACLHRIHKSKCFGQDRSEAVGNSALHPHRKGSS